jgi:2'-5' RNA ligase
MKKRRVFLAINLPESVKKKLVNYQLEWANLPIRWTKEPNLHITLVFIGYVNNEEMLEICQLTRQIVQKHSFFEIKLNQICFGPPNRPPRMVWAEGEESNELVRLKDDLENGLLNSTKSGYRRQERRKFRPHLTLGRIKQGEWRQLAQKPVLEKEISLAFPVDSVEVMESHLSRGGADYAILESAELNG